MTSSVRKVKHYYGFSAKKCSNAIGLPFWRRNEASFDPGADHAPGDDVSSFHGLTDQLVSGPASNSELVGSIEGIDVWPVLASEVLAKVYDDACFAIVVHGRKAGSVQAMPEILRRRVVPPRDTQRSDGLEVNSRRYQQTTAMLFRQV
jgi:hypothetical protein